MFRKANVDIYNITLRFAFLIRQFISRKLMQNKTFFKKTDATKS